MNKKYLILIIILLMLSGCKQKEYTITITNTDGTLLSSVKVKEGETLESVEQPVKDGYIFVTWLKDGIEYDLNTKITEDITITPIYTETPDIKTAYTITFNFGNELKTQTIKSGDKVSKPKEKVKENHTFEGWFLEGEDTPYNFDTPITKDITLIAKYEKTRVVIIYELNGGTGTIQTEISKGSILDRPKDPTKYDHNFVMWTLNNEEYTFDTPIEEDITLTAVWEAIEYIEVAFDTDGGTLIAPKLIEKNSNLPNVEPPTKTGYTFKYWSLEGNPFDLNTKIDKNLTLIAIYEENIKE